MQATFERRTDEMAGAGRAHRMRFAAAEVYAVLRAAAAERLSQLSFSKPGGRRPSSRQSPRSPRRNIVHDTLFDVRLAWRAWKREPMTAIVVALTLALGIGAATTIFSVVDGVVLRPLPFPQAGRLVALMETLPDGRSWTLSMPDFVDYRESVTSLDRVAIQQSRALTLSGEGEAQRIRALATTDGFFDMLGLDMTLGRPIVRDDEAGDAAPIVVLGHGFWRSQHAADQRVLGRTLRINGVERTIVGVAPPDIGFYGVEPDIFLPFLITDEGLENRGGHMYEAIARLAEGTTLEAARQEVGLIASRIEEEFPSSHEGQGATLVPLEKSIIGDVDEQLFLLLGAVGMLLLIACANVAAIMLARAESRDSEIAVRTALGAGTGRIVRQLLADAVLLAGIGGLLGVVLARFGIGWIAGNLASNLPRAYNIVIDPRVLVFAFGVTVGTGILVGILPAARVLRADVYTPMRAAASTGAAGSTSVGLRRGLLVVEIALAVMLVLGASLLTQSLVRLQGVDSGFVADDALTFRVGLPQSRYPTAEEAAVLLRGVEEDLGSLPGVEAVGAVGLLPFFSSQTTSLTRAGGDSEDAVEGVQFRYATPGYFDAIGTRLLSGRVFDGRDVADATPTMIVSETLARRLFGDDDAVGRAVSTEWDGHPEAIQIVGVVEDVRMTGLRREPPPAMYWPYGQWDWRGTMSFVVRGAGDPSSLTPSIRQAVRRRDAELAVYSVEMLADRTRRSVSEERLTTWLLGAFAALALLLGAVGIFGVMGYSVVRRRREIGVRVALGASPARVIRVVLSEGAALAAVGTALGAIGALAAGRFLAALLYDTSVTDPGTFIGAGALLLGVALIACYLPARRAARVDPMAVLRTE